MTTIPVPDLLYHNPRAVPYPTNTPTSLLAIRFGFPVRISSIRIAPEGVSCTFPSTWSGRIHLNTSTASPVNSLSSSDIEFQESQWEQDYPVDMPEGITTRLLLLESPAERLTISIYGYSSSGPSRAPAPAVELSPDHASIMNTDTRTEDWSWLCDWAGGKDQLCALLRANTNPETLQLAEGCLDLLVHFDPTVLPSLEADQQAVEYLRGVTSTAAQSLWRRLQLHRSKEQQDDSSPIVSRVTHLAPLRESLAEAWLNFEHDHALLSLLARSSLTADDLLTVSTGHTRSNLSRLLALATSAAEGKDTNGSTLETILDILSTPLDNPLILALLASQLPRLYTISRIRGSSRILSLDTTYARNILTALLHVSSEIIDGQSCFNHARILARPYFSTVDHSDPLRTGFDPTPHPTCTFPNTERGRALSRFDNALSSPYSGNTGLVHALSPADLVSLLAPTYYTSLRSARIPPLGISPLSPTSPGSQAQTQASAFGGKVYSLHEFRRERDAGGLGGSGLGVGTGGRPASRHVDDFAMA